MIPFFFTRYRKAPLATCISFLSSMCWLFAVLFSVGYFLNWAGLKDDMSLGGSLAMAALSALIGFGLKKLANCLAIRKQQKLAEREVASRPASTPEPTAAAGGRTTPVAYCPKCGEKAEPGDVFCVNCGAKL